MTDDGVTEKCNGSLEQVDTMESGRKKTKKVRKYRPRSSRTNSLLKHGADPVKDPFVHLPIKEDKVSSLRTALVLVSRKTPKNAHSQFILGLMYQRLGQPQKAINTYEKAEDILSYREPEIARPDLLSLIRIHHAQCVLLETIANGSSNGEHIAGLDGILVKMKESVLSDIRQSSVWNYLGVSLLKRGDSKTAALVLSTLLNLDPSNQDCIGNLGIACLQSGISSMAEKYFQVLLLRNQNHPTALVNYATFLLFKHGSVVAGAGAHAGKHEFSEHVEAVDVAKTCLLAALKTNPKDVHLWINLVSAYQLTGDHRRLIKCLEKALKAEPDCMLTRYAAAQSRVKDAERCQDPNELFWAGNEMSSMLREQDTTPINVPIAWAGLAMVHRAHHQIAAAFEINQTELSEVGERAGCSLRQAVAEDPENGVNWHQLGLHYLSSQHVGEAVKYLKLAVVRCKQCCYMWSNLGVALQLAKEPQLAEQALKRATELAAAGRAHTVYSNLGNLYRHKNQLQRAKAMFVKSLELRPGYAPALNNLGLVFVAEGKWEDARLCFDKALQSDSLLDAAKSNSIKACMMTQSLRYKI